MKLKTSQPFTVRLASKLFSLLPQDREFLCQLFQGYVDHYNGNNNINFYSNGELVLAQQMLRKCYTVFDVGANVGDWAALVLTLNPNINLHCFEPSKATFQKLLGHSFPTNVICNNIGLGSNPGESTLYVFEDGSGMNSLYRRSGLEDGWKIQPQESKETVFLDSLDHYCNEYQIEKIDFLKIDVEGHELEVFKGAVEMLSRNGIKTIQFEYGGCNIDSRTLLKDIFEFFQAFNYKMFKVYPTRLQAVSRYDQRLENFQYQNWVACSDL